jgi:hypothetical protein
MIVPAAATIIDRREVPRRSASEMCVAASDTAIGSPWSTTQIIVEAADGSMINSCWTGFR